MFEHKGVVRNCSRHLAAVLVLVGAVAVTHAATPQATKEQASDREPLASIPSGTLSARKSFVVAHEGQSYLFNPSAGVLKAPFLPNVYKPFGFSFDSRYFLYLRARGGMPTFALYLHDLQQGTETPVTDAMVHHAAWSPSSLELAFISFEQDNRFRLSLYHVSSGITESVYSGMLNPDFLEWSATGDRLLYTILKPLSADYFHDQSFSPTIREYHLATSEDSVMAEGGRSARFRGGETFVLGKISANRGRQLEVTSDEQARDFIATATSIYVTTVENTRTVVKKLDETSGALKFVGRGHVYTAIDDGVVLRDFSDGNVTYTWIADSAASTSAASADASTTFAVSWKIPFQGSAYMGQGGALFTGGACDGRACMVTAHVKRLGYALDWQQRPEQGQGNTHVLAVADGTVAATTNNVTCNSIKTTCKVGWDNYANPCNDPNGGAGNYVAIAHPDGSYSFYAHLKSGSVQVAVGQTVTQGTYIADQGHSGSAGDSTNYHGCGDHLHFQRQISAAVWAQSIATDFVETPCQLSCLTAYVSENLEVGSPSAAALMVALYPSTVIEAARTTANQIVLAAPAPAGGAAVTLTSSDPLLASVPSTVVVPAGTSSANFPINVAAVGAPTLVTIGAAYASDSATAVLTLKPASAAALLLKQKTVTGGMSVSGNEVTLTAQVANPAMVTLSSSNPVVLSVPPSVTVTAGSSFVLFDITSAFVAAATPVTVSATAGGVTKSAVLTVNPLVLSGLTLSKTAVAGGNRVTGNKVTLNGAAPPNGVVVTLTSSDPSIASAPPSVTVAAGTTTAFFPITTNYVSAATTVVIKATYGAVSKTKSLTVNPIALSGLTLSPTVLAGGKSSKATVTVNAPAPTGGVVVTLTSSNPTVASVPASVTVPAAATSATFNVIAGWVTSSTVVAISAQFNASTKTANLTVNPTVVSKLSLGATSVVGGNSVTSNRVTLNGPAPQGGAVVILGSSNANVASPPATITVAAGSTVSPYFPISTSAVTVSTSVIISASYGSVTKTAVLTVN